MPPPVTSVSVCCAPFPAGRALRKACAEIKWAKLEIKDGMCNFSLASKGATPVFSLRKILADSLEQSRR